MRWNYLLMAFGAFGIIYCLIDLFTIHWTLLSNEVKFSKLMRFSLYTFILVGAIRKVSKEK